MSDSTLLPEISSGKCSLCGICIEVCEHDALVLGEAQARFARPDDCDSCGTCEDVCPEEAIECAFTIVWGDQERD